MRNYKIKSFCKINLSLKILKKLANDYHSINSFITFCNLHDIISINKISGSSDKITFTGKFRIGINKKLNTITKVLYLLRKENFLKKQAFNVNVQKNIPHGSGLGGGSTNAADLLNFLNSKMNLSLNKSRLKKIAKKIGSDVNICLNKKSLLVINKDKVLKTRKKFKFNILIVYPNIICSTKKIYMKNKKLSFLKYKPNLSIISKNKLITFLKNENNDLQEVVLKLYPKIGEIIDFIKLQNGCYFSRITGSGSACIGIFSNMNKAIYAKKMIKLKFPKYWCVISKTI